MNIIPSAVNHPDKSESRELRRYYFKVSFIIIILLIIFNLINTIVTSIAAAILGGGFSEPQIQTGKQLISSIPVLKAIHSYGFPIAGDVAAIAVGTAITKCDLRQKFKVRGVIDSDFFRTAALCFGTSTLASFVNLIIIAAVTIIIYGISGYSLENTLSSASVVSLGNPLWLDVIIYLYICLLGPILEELLFRGVLLDGLRKYGNYFGIVMSAILFGLVHQNFIQCLPAVVMGIFLGAIAVKSGSLIPSIVIHILNNTMSSILMVLLQSFDITNYSELFSSSLPLLIAIALNFMLRFICIIVSAVIIIKRISQGRKLVISDSYTSPRTWKFFFTSIPWLLIMAYLLWNTVTSII